MDRQRGSGFEDFGTHLALIIPRTVDIFNVIENVLFPSTSFVAHDANKQIQRILNKVSVPKPDLNKSVFSKY